jgi:3-hydroxybutyryl-CoA dehydratase
MGTLAGVIVSRITMLTTAGRTKYFEDLAVGPEASMSRVVTEADIVAYAALSGDYNPLHLDAEFAAKTIFKERIAHGILSAGYISAIFGMKLPGPGAVYVSQTLNFKGPVKIDDRVESLVRIIELIPEKRRARFECVCTVAGQPVLTGEAVLIVPPRPK